MRPSLRSRDVLLIVLALVTGATDATAFLRLGHAFASVVTGNIVLLGLSAERADGHLAVVAGCALAGYAVGVIVAAPRRSGALAATPRRSGALAATPRRSEGTGNGDYWPVGTSVALGVDFALLIAFAVGWELTDQRPGSSMQVVLLTIAGMAMGAQSTAVRRLGQFSTTYLTSTLTALLEAVVARRWCDVHGRSVGILAGAVVGAGAAAALISDAPALLPLLQLLPLTLVLLASAQLIRTGAHPDD